MDTEALLNPADVDESSIINETTDEEICRAVLDAIKVWEEGLINDGDDDIDDDAHPIAHKLEVFSFTCQMQLEISYSMQSTYLSHWLLKTFITHNPQIILYKWKITLNLYSLHYYLYIFLL